jgi:hypothetical protein
MAITTSIGNVFFFRFDTTQGNYKLSPKDITKDGPKCTRSLGKTLIYETWEHPSVLNFRLKGWHQIL